MPTSAHERLPEELRREVAEELNIGDLEPLSGAGSALVDHTAKGNFRALGRRFAKETPRVAAAIAAADAESLAAALAAEGRATVELDGEPVEVLPDEVIISERPREGWSVVNEQGETVALDLEITPELRRAGLAREAHPHGAGSPQGRGVRGLRPDRAHLGVTRRRRRRRGARGGHRAPGADRRGGAGDRHHRGRGAPTGLDQTEAQLGIAFSLRRVRTV